MSDTVWNSYPGGSTAPPDSPAGMAFELWTADLLSSARAGREHPSLIEAAADYDALIDSARLAPGHWSDIVRVYFARDARTRHA